MEMGIISPCRGICQIHPVYLICKGCFRSRLEIAKWHGATEEEKQEIIESCETKREIYKELLNA